MSIRFIVVCFFLCISLAAQAQSTAQQATSGSRQSSPAVAAASSAQSKIDLAKEADIRRLLEVAGTKALMAQLMDQMQMNMKPLITNALPPGEYRAKLVDLFFEKFTSKANLQHLLDLAVPIYDKYFSHEEVKGLIKFYETPLGQKTISVLPKVMAEMGEAGRQWGQELGRQCMLEVLDEHPDLKQAMETAAAQKNQQ